MTTVRALAGIALSEPAQFIGGKRVAEGSGGSTSHYFAATGEADATVPLAGRREIDDAVRSGLQAFSEWSSWTPAARRDALLRLADLLERHRDQLVALSIRDSCAPMALAEWGPDMAAAGFRYFAGWADKITGSVIPVWPTPALDYTSEVPFGVVGVIATWNLPVHNTGLTIAPALAAGNAVVVKPSELAPFSLVRFAELCIEAGLPPGTVNVVIGGAEAGEAMLLHPGIGKVHFTGSGPTAKKILATAAQVLKPVDLELGGKSANIVFPGVDLEAAVAVSMGSIVAGSGQTCITASRLIVHESIAAEVTEIAVAVARAAVLGNPFDTSVTTGPVISAGARDRIVAMIDRAADDGAKICAGGRRPQGELERGFYVEPTVVSNVQIDSQLSQEEVFGPVLAITTFRTEAEAVSLANATRYGLAAYLQTNDVTQAHRVASLLTAGSVYVNGRGGIPPGIPFGGMKESGFGRLGGIDGVKSFLQQKNTWIGLPSPVV